MYTGQEIEKRLCWLGSFGGDPAGGVSRFLYTPEWVEAQHKLKEWMDSLGFETRFDEVGNLFGRVPGKNASTVLTGSHVDTVKNGGCYDGQYGIVAGIMAIAALKEQHGVPEYSMEVVAFAEEEGSRFPMTFWGSKSMLGMPPGAEAAKLQDTEGVSFADAIKQAGFAFKKDDSTKKSDIRAFIELHIEQGGVLEKEQIPLGIVRHIVGQRRFTLTLTGEANHAGTTPMSYRKDALVAAAAIISGVHDLAVAFGDPMVATVGKIEAAPNISNVVPAKAVFTIDARHVDSASLKDFTEKLKALIEEQSARHGVDFDLDMWMDAPPVPMDEKLVTLIKEQCEAASLPYKLMHSGAGHDAQILAPVVPTAMIFVPSVKGISHSPLEYTTPADLAQGVNALAAALHKLAY